MEHTWNTHGTHMVYSWNTHGIHMEFTRNAHAILMAYTWHAHGMDMEDASNTNIVISLSFMCGIAIVRRGVHGKDGLVGHGERVRSRQRGPGEDHDRQDHEPVQHR